MKKHGARSVFLSFVACATMVVQLAGCATSTRQAPVVDRTAKRESSGPAPVQNVMSANRGASNGSYVVKRGDTLRSIAAEHGKDARDLAAWNQLSDPNVLQVGRTLRLTPPNSELSNSNAGSSVADTNGVTTSPIGSTATIEGRALDASGTSLPPVPSTNAKPNATTTSAPNTNPLNAAPVVPALTPNATASSATGSAIASGATRSEGGVTWMWPTSGTVIAPFDDPKNKGVDVSAKPGEAVLAAADGKVVYAGSGLRGYGNLIIVKHNDEFISAYAHNSKLLVALDARVKRGQKIAEAGQTDSERAKLHFEVRRQGKPVDPLKYLPPR